MREETYNKIADAIDNSNVSLIDCILKCLQYITPVEDIPLVREADDYPLFGLVLVQPNFRHIEDRDYYYSVMVHLGEDDSRFFYERFGTSYITHNRYWLRIALPNHLVQYGNGTRFVNVERTANHLCNIRDTSVLHLYPEGGLRSLSPKLEHHNSNIFKWVGDDKEILDLIAGCRTSYEKRDQVGLLKWQKIRLLQAILEQQPQYLDGLSDFFGMIRSITQAKDWITFRSYINFYDKIFGLTERERYYMAQTVFNDIKPVYISHTQEVLEIGCVNSTTLRARRLNRRCNLMLYGASKSAAYNLGTISYDPYGLKTNAKMLQRLALKALKDGDPDPFFEGMGIDISNPLYYLNRDKLIHAVIPVIMEQHLPDWRERLFYSLYRKGDVQASDVLLFEEWYEYNIKIDENAFGYHDHRFNNGRHGDIRSLVEFLGFESKEELEAFKRANGLT